MPSASRANENTAAGAATRAAPNKWQFVNIKEPKKYQDKGLISIVRAHAMRNVRRKQRSELMVQHQKRLNQKRLRVETPESDHANSGVTFEHLDEKASDDWFVVDKANTDWPITVREILSELGAIDPSHLASRYDAQPAAGSDEGAQWSEYWQKIGEDELRALEQFRSGTCLTGTPKSFVGDGLFDPFNAMPTASFDMYDSHVLNHFASVMALNCLPVDQSKGQNPLTKTWLPYALQDSTLFLATMTFAEVHLEILSGNFKSRKNLLHKGDSIKAVNAKLGDPERALSNETIGAVAMLAAMEAILGNYKELRIHMNGLKRMVYMRGGLQSLGWDGVLHMFISWQDLLSSAMMASALRYEPTPFGLLIRGSLPYSDLIFRELGLSTELCNEIATSFQDMRYLTQTLNSWDKSKTTLETMSFTNIRTNAVHRLLSCASQKPASEMTNLDYHVETCRLAALIYIKVALHTYSPLCGTIQILKSQLMNLIIQGEANCTIGVGARQQPRSITWTLFVGGMISINKEEEEWFAQRLAKGIRASGVETWLEMNDLLGQICWLDALNTTTCRNLWRRIKSIHAEYWAAQVRSVASDWDRKGQVYWYPGS